MPVWFFSPKDLRFVHCFQAIFFFLQLPSACFFSKFCDDMNKEQVILDIQSMAFFQQKSTFFPFPRAQFTYVQHFPIGSMHGIWYTYLHLP